VRDKDSDKRRPQKELKAFEKISLEPGERKTVTFYLKKETFSHYEKEGKSFTVAAGRFEILAGASSRDISFREEIMVGDENGAHIRVTEDICCKR